MARLRRMRLAWLAWRRLRGTYLYAGALGLTDPAGAQCTHVPNYYWRQLGVGQLFGNASSWIGRAPAGCVYLPLLPGTPLRSGDVAVFRPDMVGADGHVDVVLNGWREPWVGMDQNWPLGSGVSKVEHSRALVDGVIRQAAG